MGDPVDEARIGKSTLKGTIGKIAYQNPDSHYTVARLEVDGDSAITVVGGIYPVAEGEEIKVAGSWRTHPRYGLQFQVAHWEKIEPATVEGIEKYLGSGLIKGIGPTYARRLVVAFGLDTLKVLSEEPLRVLEVEGIGEVRARRILAAWQEQRDMQDVMVFLQGHGVTASIALKIYRVFGAQTIARVKEDPYSLAREVHGIGFVLADRIANGIGVSGDSPLRVEAGVLHVLREFADRGHCFVPLLPLCQNASALLGVELESVNNAVEKLAAAGDVVLQETADQRQSQVYLAELYHAEHRVAAALHRLITTPSGLENKEIDGLTDQGLKGQREEGETSPSTLQLFNPATFMLEAEQREAVCQALQQKVLVITGGPGTGKTTLLTALLSILRGARVSFVLAAPTGRAAKRMAEAAGEEAMTIHRLLEYNPREGGFLRTEDNPLQVNVVVIDEASMVDLSLMDHLLQAVNPHSHLILVGDVDQLPSVGAGSVLRDLIDSGVVPVVVLRRIFRQHKESFIVANAHRILEGRSLLFSEGNEKRDFVFIARESEEEILATVKELVGDRIPSSLDIPAQRVIQSIQVLSPMHRGLLGTVQLNRELQNLLNPVENALDRGGSSFRFGDKVMQLRNNYDKGVFNGDLGRIVGIDTEEGKIRVDFYDKVVDYEDDELDDLNLAYATSIHKSQGSEYPVVVIPLHTSHYMMLHRSILYTAVTRGKQLVVLVGSRKALAMAIRNVRVEKRNTGLKQKLLELTTAG